LAGHQLNSKRPDLRQDKELRYNHSIWSCTR